MQRCINALISLGSHEDSLPSHKRSLSSQDYIISDKMNASDLCCCTSKVQLHVAKTAISVCKGSNLYNLSYDLSLD